MNQTAQTNVRMLRTPSDLEPHEELLRSMARERDEIGVRMRMINELVDARDHALEQVAAIRELAERSMAEAEAHEREIENLRAELSKRDERIVTLKHQLHALDAKADERLATLVAELKTKSERLLELESARDTQASAPVETDKDARIKLLESELQETAERLAQVESTLKMLAEADENS